MSEFLDDLRGISFDDFVAYAFDRPVPVGREPNWWHSGEDTVVLVVDASLQLRHSALLFHDPLFLTARFSAEQIEQGFWFLCHDVSDYAEFFPRLLWRDDAPLDLRVEAVRAMFDLYAKLFAPFPTEAATYMWWDLLAEEALEEKGNFQLPSPDQEAVRREMVSTIARILQLEPRHCQEAALHGLNHVATAEEREPLIDAFLASRGVDDKLRSYALACRAGRAQ